MPDMLHEVIIDAPPNSVYEAITTEKGLKSWWTADTEATPEPKSVAVFGFGTKAALTNLTKALSEEFAPRGVRVNAVAPGPVRTPFWTDAGGFADTVAAGSGTTAQAALDEIVPRNMAISTGRVTEAHEVADLTAFLASPRAANITGAEFVIDGGQIKTT